MINGIRHGVEGLTHGRKLLTIVLWELDAEILLRDLPELKRHLLKRPQTADNGEEHDGRDCKQKHDTGDHIRRSDLIQKPQDSSEGAGEKAEDELILTGSDILIYRMLYNLVENAIKYNRADGTVTVSAGREKNEAVLTVSDTGNGIDEAFREQIFEPFFRIDKSRSRELGGVGLGLAIVREIVRVHDGTIEVYANKHKGNDI